MEKRPVGLMILDGYGLNDNCEANAVCEGKTPIMDQLMSQCPFVKGQASGLAVGLPDGQMGNSEVGHLNIKIRSRRRCCCPLAAVWACAYCCLKYKNYKEDKWKGVKSENDFIKILKEALEA